MTLREGRTAVDVVKFVQLQLPAEEDLPFFGGGCCAVAPGVAIRAELDSWPGVSTRRVDLTDQIVTIELGPNAPALSDLIDALRAMGIDVATSTPA